MRANGRSRFSYDLRLSENNAGKVDFILWRSASHCPAALCTVAELLVFARVFIFELAGLYQIKALYKKKQVTLEARPAGGC